MYKVNIGCGQNPTKGWRNFDNSLSLFLARRPFLVRLLKSVGLINLQQLQFILFARNNEIEYGDSTATLPIADGSVAVLYSSHMLEHLDRAEADSFMREARRLLKSGGVIRLALPDLRRLAETYLHDGNADTFLESTLLCVPRPRSFVGKLRLSLVGHRDHLWMYDGGSICALLIRHGFVDPVVLAPGQTTIIDSQPLDLFERASESVYVEATVP